MSNDFGIIEKHLGFATLPQVKQFLSPLDDGRCWNCKYFVATEEVTADHYTSGDIEWTKLTLEGECRRYPPKMAVDEESGENDAIWPMLQAYHWCGEFADAGRVPEDFCGIQVE